MPAVVLWSTTMTDTSYEFVFDEYGKTEKILVYDRGLNVMNQNFVNKSTSFLESERDSLKLHGLLPPAVRLPDTQVQNSMQVFLDKKSDIEK